MGIVLFIVILSFLVIIHEFGHFFAAKWAKIKVDEFGLGYPPKAFKLFTWLKTDFTFNWILFGGFVRMQGEEGLEKDEKKTGQFYQATIFQKLVVILAGATTNFLFGVFAFSIMFYVMGIPQVISDARVGIIASNSPAQEAGLLPQTNIIALEIDEARVEVASINMLVEELGKNKGKTVTVVTTGVCQNLECDLSEHEYQVYLRTDEETPEDQGSMGIVFDPIVYIHYSAWKMPLQAVLNGFKQSWFLSGQIVNAFGTIVKNIFTGQGVSDSVAGPVGIIHQAQKIGLFEQGFLSILSFAGMLSINLAVMNVIPFPPLDGGRALFIALSGVIKKKKYLEKFEYYFNYAGYIFLLGLIVLVTFKDIVRIFR